jgi:ribosome recycling factor
MQDTSKKLAKILPKDLLKKFEEDIEKLVKNGEKDVDDLSKKKQAEIESV